MDMKRSGQLSYTVLILLFLFPLIPAAGVSLTGFEWEGGVRWIGVYEEDLGGSSSRWSNEMIVRFPLSLGEGELELVPSLSMMILNYRISSGRVVPTDIETRACTALVPTIELPLRWRFFRADTQSYAFSGGVAAELPFPIEIADPEATGSIISRHYSIGRFLLPFLRVSGRWSLAERFQIVGRLGAYYPLHRVWDDSGAAWYDHLMAGLSVGLFFPSGGD